MKKFVSAVFLLTITIVLSSLLPLSADTTDVFSRTVVGTGVAHSIVQTSDGGYVIVGGYKIHSQAFAVKVDHLGREEWRQTWEQYSTATSVIKSGDNGYIIAGSSTNGHLTLTKIEETGNIVWQKEYASLASCYPDLVRTSDGGYVIGFSHSATAYNDVTFGLLKTDSSGNLEWEKSYENDEFSLFCSLDQTSDGTFVLAGYSQLEGPSEFKSLIITVDSSGNLENKKMVTHLGFSQTWAVVALADGSVAISGVTDKTSLSDRSGFPFLTKLDSQLNELWTKVYDSEWGQVRCLVETSDGGYGLVGYGGAGGLIRSDASGNVVWKQAYTLGSGVFWSVIQTADQGFALVGSNYYFVKTDADGNTLPKLQTNVEYKRYAQIVEGSYEVEFENGVVVSIADYAVPHEAILEITSNYLGLLQPEETSKLLLGQAYFYDVKITSADSFSHSGIATISFKNVDFTDSINIVQYWNGIQWVTVESKFDEPNTLIATFPVSALTGTIIVLGDGTSTNNQSPLPDLSSNSDSTLPTDDRKIPIAMEPILWLVAVVSGVCLSLVLIVWTCKKKVFPKAP
ncbi:MAG: hypothetical protein ACQCN6_08095 [Candidatus Bathyarchaeia archaeon]